MIHDIGDRDSLAHPDHRACRPSRNRKVDDCSAPRNHPWRGRHIDRLQSRCTGRSKPLPPSPAEKASVDPPPCRQVRRSLSSVVSTHCRQRAEVDIGLCQRDGELLEHRCANGGPARGRRSRDDRRSRAVPGSLVCPALIPQGALARRLGADSPRGRHCGDTVGPHRKRCFRLAPPRVRKSTKLEPPEIRKPRRTSVRMADRFKDHEQPGRVGARDLAAGPIRRSGHFGDEPGRRAGSRRRRDRRRLLQEKRVESVPFRDPATSGEGL